MREIHDPHEAEYQGEPQRRQRIERPVDQAVCEQLEEEVHQDFTKSRDSRKRDLPRNGSRAVDPRDRPTDVHSPIAVVATTFGTLLVSCTSTMLKPCAWPLASNLNFPFGPS